MERRQLYIDGMTCINCQKKIENCLRKRVEIKEASVSYETGVAKVLYDANKITLQEIIRIINDLGYDVKSEANSWKDIVLRTAKELVVILAVFLLLQHFGILNRLAPDSLADASMGYGMLFMIGLITSVHVRTVAIPLQWIRSVKAQEDVIHGRFWKKIKQKQIAK